MANGVTVVDIEDYLKSNEHISKVILMYRTKCLVNRILYYVYDRPLLEDQEYDLMENRLKAFVRKYPEIAKEVLYDNLCPSKTVGSSILSTYPKEIQELALKIYEEKNQ